MIAHLISHRSSPSECSDTRLDTTERARRIIGTRLKYIAHSSFDDPIARDAILAPLTDSAADQVSRRLQPSEWLTTLPAARSGPTFLSRKQEAHLFRKMNYLKYRAQPTQGTTRSGLAQPRRPRRDRTAPMRGSWTEKNRIIERYLRLVVSIAKTHVRAGYDLSECISDGNLALIHAVDGFDFARGNRFSSYATWAIRNLLVENERRFSRRRSTPVRLQGGVRRGARQCCRGVRGEEAQNQRRSAVKHWLGQLDRRERRIIVSRYGLGGAPEQTLAQLGQELGICKERVRQIEVVARRPNSVSLPAARDTNRWRFEEKTSPMAIAPLHSQSPEDHRLAERVERTLPIQARHPVGSSSIRRLTNRGLPGRVPAPFHRVELLHPWSSRRSKSPAASDPR